MTIPIPPGIIPVRNLTTDEILYGGRVTSWRWEVLEHTAGSDHLVGFLDGVVEDSASFSWSLYTPVKGSGNLKVTDLETAEPGLMRIRDVPLASARLRPVQIIEGLPEIPWGVFLMAAAPEAWSEAGRVLSLELQDRATVPFQDKLGESYTVDTATPILSAVADVLASAGESINVDATVTGTLTSEITWPAKTKKLQIVNELLKALNYDSLRVSGQGEFEANPYVLPADRSLNYELLTGITRELIDGETSIYSQEWSRDLDMFEVPNKVVAEQTATGGVEPLTGEWTNTDPDSPFSYQARGNRWIVETLPDVDTPAGTDAEVIAFLEQKARASLIAYSSVQATVSLKHLPLPIRVGDVMRFANAPAGIDARHVVTSIKLAATSLGLMETELQELVVL